MGNKHYTQEEIEIIKKEVIKSPTNLLKAFKKAANKLNRTPGAISHMYYRAIKEGDDKLFMTVSSRKVASNSKITTKKKAELNKPSKWRRILAIIME